MEVQRLAGILRSAENAVEGAEQADQSVYKPSNEIFASGHILQKFFFYCLDEI